MPWGTIKLNDGTEIPSIAFGTWTAGSGQIVTDRVDQALDAGFDHIDTAQSYRNESEAGKAIRESGLARDQIFITTKFSGFKDVEDSIQDSLKNLGVSYVDLYLVHNTRIANGDIPGLWKKMEKIHSDGLAKTIGVSNFQVDDLKTLLKDAKIVPVVNQIIFNPYEFARQSAVHNFGNEHGIITEAYSALNPITRQPGGPLDEPLAGIAAKHNATPDQVLLAWVKAKGAVAVTYSSRQDRLNGYLAAGDIDLSEDDVAALDQAGAKNCWLPFASRDKVKSVVSVAAFGWMVWGVGRYLGIWEL